MKPAALLIQSFRSIWSNKVRSSLTILGVVIGITAVLLLVSLGNSLKANVINQLGDLDATRILVGSKDPEQETAERKGGRFSFSSISGLEKITESDYQLIKGIKDVSKASPESNATIDVSTTANATTATAYQLYGVDTAYFEINDHSVKHGKLLSSTEVNDASNVVILGEAAAEKIFPDVKNVIGQTIYMKDVAYTVIGVLGKAEATNALSSDASLNIYTGYKEWGVIQEKDKLGSIHVEANKKDSVEAITATINTELLKKHNISDEAKADFTINSNKELLATLGNVSGGFAKTLSGVATISLIVGGIGIMNIMLVTVTERTREIGLRRAIGAKKRHVVIQFLTESILLTTIGGILGVIVGIGLNKQASELFGTGIPGTGGQTVQILIDIPTIILAVSISVGIGIVFGLFPAIKAARLDPVEALRYE